eukprot:SAG11_NODE_12442_length_703_cov_1.125828_1_plen_47_part_01
MRTFKPALILVEQGHRGHRGRRRGRRRVNLSQRPQIIDHREHRGQSD